MNIKKELIMGTLFALLAGFLIYLLVNNATNQEVTQEVTPEPNNTVENPEVNQNLTSTYTEEEVSTHNNPDDCWVIVNKSVYDLSGFSANHPGGTSPIEFNCGKDATTAFTTRAGRGPHPDQAQQTLESFKIGELSE